MIKTKTGIINNDAGCRQKKRQLEYAEAVKTNEATCRMLR